MQNVDVALGLNFSEVCGEFWAGALVWDLSVSARGVLEDVSACEPAAQQPGSRRRDAGALARFPAGQGHGETFP